MDTKLLFENESYAIRGAYFEVNKSKDHGFFEAVYQGAPEFDGGQSLQWFGDQDQPDGRSRY